MLKEVRIILAALPICLRTGSNYQSPLYTRRIVNANFCHGRDGVDWQRPRISVEPTGRPSRTVDATPVPRWGANGQPMHDCGRRSDEGRVLDGGREGWRRG